MKDRQLLEKTHDP